MFSFSKYCQTVFQSGYTKLYSHQSGLRVPVALPPPPVIGGVSFLITHSGGCVVVSCFNFNFLNEY